MKKRRFPWLLIILCLTAAGLLWKSPEIRRANEADRTESGLESAVDAARDLFRSEPEDVQKLREQELIQTDAGHQEYYFGQLNEAERRVYREMLEGIRNREEEFYLTSGDDSLVDRVYHALLKDHPELFWIHNRETVYKTTYEGADYSMFSPGYTYTEQEVREILQAMEQAWQNVSAGLQGISDPYEQVKAVYTYVIDNTEYMESEHDQNIAGVFWKKQAVCAGYARAVQYLLERLGIPCIYVEGNTIGSSEGHASR